MTSLDHLLPAADEAVRCADHTRRIAIDPGGTAIRADRVVLVETGLPWPKPVFDHPTLREIDPLCKAAPRPTRLLACQPGAGTATAIHVFDRLPTSTRERRFAVTSPDELLDLVSCLVVEEGGDEPTSGSVHPLFDDEMVDPALLVCTQGSHDVCCGSDGERLARAVEDQTALTGRGPRVFRVSHTGGHRFAPTAMTLPDGRMWAYLVVETVDQIIHRTGDGAGLADYCRGWWGAEKGPAQMAERAVLAEIGFDLDSKMRSVNEVGPGRFQVIVEGADGAGAGPLSREVVVEESRRVPTVACRQPGGQPAKIAVEYRATIVD